MTVRQIFQIVLAVLAVNFFVSANAAVTTYTEDKPSVTVDPHQPTFIIKLKSNPTTGYSWFLREYNNNLLLPVKHAYQHPDAKLAGAGGFELWTFRMKPAGFIVPQQTTIRFIYARPWQGADNSTQVVFRVTTTAK